MKLLPFEREALGLSGVIPEGWTERREGKIARGASPIDPTTLLQQGFPGASLDDLKIGLMPHLGLTSFPEPAGERQTDHLRWTMFRHEGSVPGMEAVKVKADIALTQAGGWSYVVALLTLADEHELLHDQVFIPALEALSSLHADESFQDGVELNKDRYEQLLREKRQVFRAGARPDFPCLSDQKRGLPAPPAQKAAAEGQQVLTLPAPDRSVLCKSSIFDCIADRKSRRRYADEQLSLEELAFLLWATQGLRATAGGDQTSFRTVPSSGTRHPFETYVAVTRVDGLTPGMYRYLPLQHSLLLMFAIPDFATKVAELATDQQFAGQAAACFLWSVVPYRTEWRFGLEARKDILIEAGHVCQNLYLACEAIGCGTCAIAAYDQEVSDTYLGLDGTDEMVIYLAPVGKVVAAK